MKRKISFARIADVSVTHILLIIINFIFLFPCLWLILASFSRNGAISTFNGFFPAVYSTETMRNLFTDTALYDYPRWFLNTLFIACMSAAIGTLFVTLTAYTMSRFEFRGRKTMMKAGLILGMFPSFMGMIAIYLLMTQFGMVNNHWGLILIYSAGAPLTFLAQKGFFDTIPKSIDEAARIDGANNATIFFKINLPLSKPILVYTALITFAWPWSDFILPSLLLTRKSMYTVAVGLMNLDTSEFARFAAGSVLIAVPIIVLYFFLTKYMIKSILSGAMKG